MLYFANASSDDIREEMRKGTIGMIATPREGKSPADARWWIADNSCFGKKEYIGNDAFLKWLKRRAPHASRCRFATAPDVVGDAKATIERSMPMLPKIREAGYKAGFVGQDGLENLTPPWSSFDAFFVGGSTEWKLGPAAAELVQEAKARGKWRHMGRVNSYKRLKYAHDIGCNSVDGTFLAFGPTTNLPRLMKWLTKLKEETNVPA